MFLITSTPATTAPTASNPASTASTVPKRVLRGACRVAMTPRGGPAGRPGAPVARPWPPRGGPPAERELPPARAPTVRCIVAADAATGRCEEPLPPTGTGGGSTAVASSVVPLTSPTGDAAGCANTGSGISRVAAASAGAPTPAGAAGGRFAAAPATPAGTGAGAPAYAGGDRAPTARTEISAGSAATWSARPASSFSSSWTRCPASSARRRSVAVSRAWAKYRSTRSATAMNAANPASAPTDEMKWCTERANGIVCISRAPSLRREAGESGICLAGLVGLAGGAGLASGAVREARTRQLRHVLGERGRIALEHEQVDLAEDVLDGLRVERLPGGPQDLLGGRRLRALVRVEQVLVELLPGTGADDLDRDVALWLEPGQPDHRLREVDNRDRLAHLEHEHLAAALAQRAGANDQLDRLRDRHEVARHPRIGDR